MSQYDNRYGQARVATRAGVESIDEGLRAYMLSVYNYLALGLVVTGAVAYLLFTQIATTDPALAAKVGVGGAQVVKMGNYYLTQLGVTLFRSPLAFVIMFAPLGLLLFLMFKGHNLSFGGAQGVYWLLTVLIGLSMSTIFLRYGMGSIAKVFFITAASFGALSLYGYTTKKDLSGWGTFLFMGMIGVFLAIIANMFLKSPALHFAISVIGVLVFAGFTAYDTQQIKEVYYEGDAAAVQGKKAVFGALSLYIDFINMFQFLLSLLGGRD